MTDWHTKLINECREYIAKHIDLLTDGDREFYYSVETKEPDQLTIGGSERLQGICDKIREKLN